MHVTLTIEPFQARHSCWIAKTICEVKSIMSFKVIEEFSLKHLIANQDILVPNLNLSSSPDLPTNALNEKVHWAVGLSNCVTGDFSQCGLSVNFQNLA